MKFINERGGHAQVTELKAPKRITKHSEMFEELYKHEVFVSNAINELVHIALLKKIMRHITFTMVRRKNKLKKNKKNILDKIHLIGDDKGLYLFDRDIQQPSVRG
jgi:ferritin